MTNAELAILGLVAEKPRHGYDIEQVIKARGMRDWTEIGFSSIYYLLNKLEKSELIESQLQKPDGRGPARKVYHITQKGRQNQVEGTIQALSIPQSGSVQFLLGLSNFLIVPREQVIEALNSYVQQLEKKLEYMQERAKVQQSLPPFVEAMFDYTSVLAEAELNWMKNFVNEVEAGNV